MKLMQQRFVYVGELVSASTTHGQTLKTLLPL